MTDFKDRLACGDRVVTLRDREGAALFELDARYALAAAVLTVAKFPRIAAAAALGALVRGMSITVEPSPGEDAAQA